MFYEVCDVKSVQQGVYLACKNGYSYTMTACRTVMYDLQIMIYIYHQQHESYLAF